MRAALSTASASSERANAGSPRSLSESVAKNFSMRPKDMRTSAIEPPRVTCMEASFCAGDRRSSK